MNTSTLQPESFVLMPARRTFVQGIASIIDFAKLDSQYVISATGKEADALAISADWRAVGKDLQCAYDWAEKEVHVAK